MSAGLLLTLASATEVIDTSALKANAGFSRLTPNVMVVIGCAAAFYLLGLTPKQIPPSIAYAAWSGAGTVLITLIGVLAYRQRIDLAGIAGISLIVAGVLVLNLLSKSGAH